MTTRNPNAFVALACLCVLGCDLAGATEPDAYFVSAATGNDSNSGTSPDTPFKTIQAAVKRAEGGSTITLMEGEYDERKIVLKDGTAERPTVLRARRPGRAFVGRFRLLTDFREVEGSRYVYEASFAEPPSALSEIDTGVVLRHVATEEDVAEIRGSWAYDERAKTIYVHPSDSAGVTHHQVVASMPGNGVIAGNHCVVDGLVLRGFGGAAVDSRHKKGVTVQNCVAYGNGYGIRFYGGQDYIARGNHVWGNEPAYGSGAQIYVTGGKVSDVLVENNVAHHSPSRSGIRFYGGGPASNCLVRGNLMYENGNAGFYYKIRGSHATQVASNNVAVRNRVYDFGTNEGGHNTFHRWVRNKPRDTDLVLGNDDWRVADEAYNDYRLQADSPARGKAPDGSDLGAFPYDGSVLYVGPDGDDSAAGTSVGSAWKTLAHACATMRPGQTLYILPGTYAEPLMLRALKATPEAPTRLRSHGKGEVRVACVSVDGCENANVEYLQVRGGNTDGFRATNARNVVFDHCKSLDNQGAGFACAASEHVVIEHCAAIDNRGPAVDLGSGAADVEVVSTILMGGAQPVRRAAGAGAVWMAFNSVNAPEHFADLHSGDCRARTDGPAATGGRYHRPIGPDGLMAVGRIARQPIENIRVSTTRTTADILYDTPGRLTGTMLEWGPTAQYGSLYDRGASNIGEYETVHTASIVGLEPGTRYPFRVGFRRGKDVEWSEDQAFTTATHDPVARRLFVSTAGDDARDGLSPATAWRTVRKAGWEARPGDTVTILPGRYPGPLRPLRTGASEQRRITFRAERPLTVFLDGGYKREYAESGRAHALLIQGKAYLTVENLVLENCSHSDKGLYRDGWGAAGLLRVSGSAMIDLSGIVMDGRTSWMSGLGLNDAGLMPGLPEPAYSVRITDSIAVACWGSVKGWTRAPALIEHFLSYLPRIGTFGGHDKTRFVIRNSVIHDRSEQKRTRDPGSIPIYGESAKYYDTDYNAYCWMPGSVRNLVRERRSENGPRPELDLAGWRKATGQDLHSIEIQMTETDGVLPATHRLDYDRDPRSKGLPLRTEDFVLPKDSPLRGKGEGGADIGPRWERYLRD
ncbi:MAG: right-handed parallel beta-helix repeat-containing protein [Kiritimatiellae bacterium]|nr:right-handed parallel beta-helix repeat-containing protein [Kiritimatiellia bacterium]